MDVYCTDLSLAASEPLAGTAASADRFLVLEHAVPWGPKGVDDSGLPEAVVAHLAALGKRHRRARVQLVRRPERARSESVRLFLATSEERTQQLTSLTLPDLDALRALDLEPWLRGEAPPPGTPETEPLYLVCVHGKRDRCCARLGMPVYRGLGERVGERALQTTHLGGHRFAATLLVLPQGLCYGRVLASEVDALVEATERGEIYDLGRLRGRTAYASEAQAGEIALREQLGERRSAALQLAESTREGEAFRVSFVEVASGRTHETRIVREAQPPMPQSCGAAPKPSERLVTLKTSAAG